MAAYFIGVHWLNSMMIVTRREETVRLEMEFSIVILGGIFFFKDGGESVY
jgi:hypothetical protein